MSNHYTQHLTTYEKKNHQKLERTDAEEAITLNNKPLKHDIHWKKKWSHFDLKTWVTSETKILPVIPSNWSKYKSISLDIEIQFDSNTLQLLGISGRILVPPVS